MSAVAGGRSRRRRVIIWLLLAAVLLSLLYGLRLILQPERMGALIVAQAEQATGLRFDLDAPARLGLWPRLHLQLVGVRIVAPSSAAPLLDADRIELALPLSVLWSTPQEIGRIDLQSPDIDLPRVIDWLRPTADQGPPEPLRLPQFATEAHLRDGRLRGAGFELHAVDATLSPLRDGQPASLRVDGSWRGDDAAPPREFALELTAVPREQPDGLQLDAIDLKLRRAAGEAPQLLVSGELALRLPAALHAGLRVELADASLLPVAELPPALLDGLRGPLDLDYDGPSDLGGELRLHRPDDPTTLDLVTRPAALLDWINAAGRDPLPPVTGVAAAPEVVLGDLQLRGLRVEIGDDRAAEPDAGEPAE